MKYTIKRPRPDIPENTPRLIDLRVHEAGSWSMPSGDSAAAAAFCFIYASFMGLPWIYLILPLVMCGRVYFHCHYIFDTIVGAMVGTFWGVFMFEIFIFVVPFAQWVAGPGTF